MILFKRDYYEDTLVHRRYRFYFDIRDVLNCAGYVGEEITNDAPLTVISLCYGEQAVVEIPFKEMAQHIEKANKEENLISYGKSRN